MSNPKHITDVLADWAVTTTFKDLPDAVIHATKRSIVDSLGVMAGGSGHPAVDLLLTSLADMRPEGAEGSHVVVGRPLRLDISDATLVNGTMAAVLDFDDTILPTRCHISAPMLSALLAVSERAGATGRELITAFVVGFELVTRLAETVYGGNKGWHGTGIMGPLGVAAAAGRLLGLDRDATSQAFALAAGQASGLRSSFGSMAKAWNLGRAGANGVQSALLAARGYTGGWGVLDADGGFCELFTDAPVYGMLTDELGTRWAIERNGFKPHPCGFVAHAAIDAVTAAREQNLLQPDDVEAIHLTVAPETLVLTGKQRPATGLEAKFSVYHSVAAAYLDGFVSTETYSDGAAADARYRALADRVDVVADPSYGQGEANVEVVARDGTTTSAYIPHALGTEENPMSDLQLAQKYERLARPVFGVETERLLEVVWTLEEHDVSAVIAGLTSSG